MNKRLVTFLVFLCFSVHYAQHNKTVIVSTVAYMDIKSYRNYKLNVDNTIDSIGYKIDKNDTIIIVRGYKTKGVKVPYEEKDSIFLERYKDIVFNKKYQKIQNNLPTMKTWKTEIKIYVDKSINKNIIREFKEFTKYIDKEVDSLKISFVNDKDKSNYFIYGIKDGTTKNFDYRIISKEGYYLEWNTKQNIYRCALKLNTQSTLSDAQVESSLKVNFIRTLGYFYLEPSQSDCTSYFSICPSDQKTFGKKDLEVLKYHYSYGICKGTNLMTFEKNHKDAKEKLKMNIKTEFVQD